MVQGWRLTTVNGLLLACYFVPAWTVAAFKIIVFPMRGIYDRANIGPALFVNDTFNFSMLGTVRFAWLLVLAKLIVVTYFLLFCALTLRVRGGRSANGDEALALALLTGGVLSLASMLAASSVGEMTALRLHATESLMLLAALVLLAIDVRSFGMSGNPAIAFAPPPQGPRLLDASTQGATR